MRDYRLRGCPNIARLIRLRLLDKYLKSRKGRALSLDEINHVGAIADCLAFTIEQMAKIDKAYQTAFAERG